MSQPRIRRSLRVSTRVALLLRFEPQDADLTRFDDELPNPEDADVAAAGIAAEGEIGDVHDIAGEAPTPASEEETPWEADSSDLPLRALGEELHATSPGNDYDSPAEPEDADLAPLDWEEHNC